MAVRVRATRPCGPADSSPATAPAGLIAAKRHPSRGTWAKLWALKLAGLLPLIKTIHAHGDFVHHSASFRSKLVNESSSVRGGAGPMRRFAAPGTCLAMAAGLAACAGHHGVSPSFASGDADSPAVALRSGSNFVVDSIQNPSTLSPDGTHLFLPHMVGTKLRSSIFLKTSTGYVNQREYSTPFGPLTISEQSIEKVQPPPRPSAVPTSQPNALIQQGTTTAGGTYVIVAGSANNWLVQLTIGGTLIVARVPAGTPLSLVDSFLNSVS